MSAITAKASRKMKKYAVLTREPRCFLGSFDFSWEQRKFEEIAVRSSVICSDDTLPRVEYEDIVSGTGRLNKDIYAKQSIKSGIAFHQGDVLYGKLRPYLQNWLLPTFDGLAVGDFWVLQPQNADSSFLYRLIQSRQFDEVANQSTGTKMPRADWKLVSKTVFSIPSNISEQAAIGTYFTAHDSLITLHQRKCALLFSHFQALISMMFTTSTFSWEQRKLSDLIIEYKETVDSDCTLPVLTSSKTEGVVLQEEHFGRVQNHDITGYNILPRNYCTYRNRSDGVDFTFNINRCCDKGIISKFYPVFYGNNSDIFFISMVLNYCDEVVREIAYTCTGTGQKVLSFLDLQKMNIRVPSYDEQKKISQYFEQLDNLITLHQRKCISFTGRAGRLISTVNKKRITSSWEQRKLGELALFNPKDELPQTFEYVDLESVVGTEMLSHRTEVKSSAPSRAQRLAHTGDLFYQTVRPYQKNNYLFEKPDNNYVFSTGYAQMRPYVDGYFLLSLLQSERFVKVVLDNCTGTSYPAINANDLAEIEVAAPSDESEAQRIGTIFRSIDNLITLHQRKPFLMKWRNSDANRNQTNRLVL